MTDINYIIASHLRQRRRELGISQRILGKELNVSYQQLQKYERAKNRISAGTLYVAARFLDKPIEWFFSE